MREKCKKWAVLEWLCAFVWLACWAVNDNWLYLVIALLFAGVATYKMRKEK